MKPALAPACITGKRAYADRLGAMLALAGCKHRANGKRRERSAYRCPHCKQWHLTCQAPRSR